MAEHYEVVVAGNGLQAIDIIQQKPISIVITDVMMPKMDGCELCQYIKNSIEFSGIPVVMLTAKTTVEARLKGYMVGAEEYIEKPFSMKYLLARIDTIIAKYENEAKARLSAPLSISIEPLYSHSDKFFVDRFRQLVEMHLADDKLNVSFLCEQLGVSQTTFFRKLKSAMNVSPNDYIRVARIERAASMLLSVEDARISDVAYASGFSSPSYFTRCFIQHFGVSPKVYANQKKNECGQ